MLFRFSTSNDFWWSRSRLLERFLLNLEPNYIVLLEIIEEFRTNRKFPRLRPMITTISLPFNLRFAIQFSLRKKQMVRDKYIIEEFQ